MNQDVLFMEIAIKEALACQIDVPVGALVVKGDEIIGRGGNRREELNDPCAHAEMLAIKEASQTLKSWRLSGATIYCTLEPCPMCAEAIIQARLARLVFGAYDPISGATGSAFNLFVQGRSLPLPEVMGGICEERCRNILLDFFRQRRESVKKDADL